MENKKEIIRDEKGRFVLKENNKNLPEGKIVKMFVKDSLPIRKIADYFKCDYDPVYNILKKNNIKMNPKGFQNEHKQFNTGRTHFKKGQHHKEWGFKKGNVPWNKLSLNEKELIRLYSEENYTWKELSEKFNCDFDVVQRILKENNLIISSSNSERMKKLFKVGKIKPPMEDKNHTMECRIKMSAIQQEIPIGEWKGFAKLNPYPITFNNKFKLAIKQRDGFMRLKCGMREEDHIQLFGIKESIHHIDYIYGNTFPENCCVLCNRCNIEVNSNRESWKKFFQSLLSERYNYKYTEEGIPIINIEVKQ
jgi:predicted DNA-binding protein YlxM (UPF0122 family)